MMHKRTLALLATPLIAGVNLVNAAGNIFQGNSIMIIPSNTSTYPGDASFTASNFYCYVADEGYLSFGWYVSLMNT